MTGRAIPPLTDLHVRLVSKCNLNCKHCYASDWFSLSERLPTDLVCNAIDEAMDLGLRTVTLTGGEPLLHNDVPALLRHCVARERRVKLETNGILLRRNNGEIRDLIVAHKDLVYLYVSYDLGEQRGISDQGHDQIRATILDLHEHGVDVRLQSSLTAINIGRLDDLTELARVHGIPQRMFMDHSLMGNGTTLGSLDLDTILATATTLAATSPTLEMELPPLISGRVSEGCGWGLHRCELMANGDVTTCAPITFTHTTFVAGNLRERSLTEIWRDSDYFDGMRTIEQSDFRGVCGKCRYWETCRGSCRAYAWSHGDDWFSPYSLCQRFAERYPDRVREHLLDEDIAVAGSPCAPARRPRVQALADVASVAGRGAIPVSVQ